MTAKEFDNQKWYKDMMVEYCGVNYPVMGVDFHNRRILIDTTYGYEWIKNFNYVIVEEEPK